jgi:transposase
MGERKGDRAMLWIGVDAHKRVHQAVALDEGGSPTAETVPNTPAGWAALLQWAQAGAERAWAVEGAGSFGRGLAQFLAERGERVYEVNPRWTAQRRRSARRPGKSDRLDALAVARLLRDEAATLPVVLPEDPAAATAQLWSRLRDDLVTDMTRLRNRLHALLLLCDPQYPQCVPRLTTQKGLAACLAYTAPGDGPLPRARERAVRQVAAQLALLAGQERELRGELEALVAARFTPLLAIEGVGALTAAGLIAELGPPRRGLGEAQVAAMAGVAPLEASTAGGVRHRLNRGGNRRLNRFLHVIALIQARVYPPAQAYLARRQQAGRTARESRRALKRHLVRRVWRQWQACWSSPPEAALPLAA